MAKTPTLSNVPTDDTTFWVDADGGHHNTNIHDPDVYEPVEVIRRRAMRMFSGMTYDEAARMYPTPDELAKRLG
jgi:hypothetical protein